MVGAEIRALGSKSRQARRGAGVRPGGGQARQELATSTKSPAPGSESSGVQISKCMRYTRKSRALGSKWVGVQIRKCMPYINKPRALGSKLSN